MPYDSTISSETFYGEYSSANGGVLTTGESIAFEFVSAGNNSAVYSGGFLCNSAGSTLFSSSVFLQNVVQYYGGVLYAGGNVEIQDTVFTGNAAARSHIGKPISPTPFGSTSFTLRP